MVAAGDVGMDSGGAELREQARHGLALGEDFCRYYAAHRNKTVVYYFDATALGSNYAVNDKDFRYNVVKEFERHGWRIESVYLG